MPLPRVVTVAFGAFLALTAVSTAHATTNSAGQEVCNPVLDREGKSVVDTTKYAVIHRDSTVCPETTAPAAPPVTPPPVAEKAPPVYYVFFDFDKSNISPTGQQVIRTVADEAKRGAVPVVHVAGYTDTVGSQAYNLRLSERRATAVQGALRALGVNATAQGFGKTNLLVPTADGVREPSNRRAEIRFQ